jgi:hypothetical protein
MANRAIVAASLLLSVVLVGCEAVPTQENPDAAELNQNPSDNAGNPQNNGQNAPESNAQPSPPQSSGNQMEYLSGQILSLQEQVIQIKADTQELRQNAQVLLARLQLLNSQGLPQNPVANSGGAPSQNTPLNEAQVNRLVQDVSALLDQTSSSYELVSSYTAKGQWVLIRYDRYTGETWLADQNRWNALNEAGVLPRSVYEVQIQRADKDIKGYVAARVDKRSGQTWWLREETWQSYQ